MFHRTGPKEGGDPSSGEAVGEPTSSSSDIRRTRKRTLNDKLLHKIKSGLEEFCSKNMLLCDDNDRLAITSGLIQLKATEIKNVLLTRSGVVCTDDEHANLLAFKASKSWACVVGNQLGYLTNASVNWSERNRVNTSAYIEMNSNNPSSEEG